MDQNSFLDSLKVVEVSKLKKIKSIGKGGESKVLLSELKSDAGTSRVAVKLVKRRDPDAKP